MNTKLELIEHGNNKNTLILYHNKSYTTMRDLPDIAVKEIITKVKNIIAENVHK